MKKRWILWWVVSAFWFVLFIVGTIFVWVREIDGAGVIQTPEAKLISFIVLVIAFIFPAIIQIIWLIINFVTGKNKNPQYQQ